MQNMQIQPKIHWKRAIAITLFALILSLLLALIQPFEYRTDVKVLIIQKNSGNFDPYLSVKSAERIGQSLAEVVYTSSFIQKVRASEYVFPEGFFETDPHKLRKQWKNLIHVEVIAQTGVLNISAYNVDTDISHDLASAVADVLVTQGAEYHGAGDAVVIKIIDSAITTVRPVRPNIPLYLGIGLASGIFVVMLLHFFAVQEYYQSTQEEDGVLFVDEAVAQEDVSTEVSEPTIHASISEQPVENFPDPSAYAQRKIQENSPALIDFEE